LYKSLDFFVKDLSLFLLFIACFIYVLVLRANSLKSFKFFTTYLVAILLIMIYSASLAREKLPNLHLSHFYFGFQFILLSLFYKELFVSRLQKKLINIALIIVPVVLMIQYGIKPNLFYSFNTLEVFICSFPLVIYSIIHLFNSLTRNRGFLFVNIGILIYISSSTLIFILSDFTTSIDSSIAKNIWFVNKILYVVYLLLILTEWYKNYRRVKKV